MPQCVGKMVQVSNLYLQMGASKVLNKRLSEFGRKPTTFKHFTSVIFLFHVTLCSYTSARVESFGYCVAVR